MCICTPDHILDDLIIPGIRRLYPTYLIKTISFANWMTRRKKDKKSRNELGRYRYLDQHLTPAKGASPPVDVIYLNLQKAFDKVPHQRVILILKVSCKKLQLIARSRNSCGARS